LIRELKGNFMQKLSRRRKTDTPRNASLVPCSVDLSLNKEETLSERVLSTLDTTPEVNLPQRKEGQNLRVSVRVYVLNLRGEPLMPCNPRNGKKLLREGRAIDWFHPLNKLRGFHQKRLIKE
jgi:hypothetical protein